MATRPLQTPIGPRAAAALRRTSEWIEARLDAERERIGLWLPFALGSGIAAWFALPTERHWIGLLFVLGAGALAGLLIGWQSRFGRAVAIGCGVMALGLLLIWGRALWVAAPVLGQPVVTEFSASVESVEPLPAKDQVRLIVRPIGRPDLPPRLRVTAAGAEGAGIAPDENIGLRARLMPPPTASLPGRRGGQRARRYRKGPRREGRRADAARPAERVYS
jgi:competence protein ComEC